MLIVQLSTFFALLEIDSNLFNDLFKIDIRVDYDNKEDDNCAVYYSGNNNDSNYILIEEKYMSGLLDDLNSFESKQIVINTLAVSIVHELLHANRDILIKVDNPLPTSENDRLLDDAINTKIYLIFDRFIPLKSIDYGNNIYTVIAYDKNDKCYVYFNKQIFGIGLNRKVNMLDIGLELNAPLFNHTINSKESRISNDFVVTNAVNFDHESYDSTNSIKINNQIHLEESIIETLAILIIYLRKQSCINLNSFYEYLKNNYSKKELHLACKILNKMGFDTIKWFMLSCRQEQYDDRLYKAFNDKYESLLLCFNSIINYDNNQYLNGDINDANEIIDDKLKSRN